MKTYDNLPCDFDHNGECLRCDCWASECAWQRLLNNNFKYKNKEELIEMFLKEIRDRNIEKLI